ncbi:hypothetical protein ACP70R_026906 [Stipagrostis hirtigluma subsp. patula]
MRPRHAHARRLFQFVPPAALGFFSGGDVSHGHRATVVLKVAMSCGGCSGAVKRVLSKMEGVESFDIDMKEQKVTVKGNVKPEDVFETVSKTGKKTSFWEDEAPAPAASAPAAEPAPTDAAEAAPIPTAGAAPTPTDAAEAAPIPAEEAAPTDAAEAAPVPAAETAPSAAAEAPVAAPASEAAPAKADA